MSVDYFADPDSGLQNGINSRISPSQGSGSVRNNALSNKLTSVLSRSYADPEVRDTLSILDARGIMNDPDTRRNLRLDAQKEIIDCNGAIVQDFGKVAKV
jgi:conserved oligomeric Golgi complex subunit 6